MRTFFSLLLYRIIFLLLSPLLLLALLIRSRDNVAYRQRLFERLGWVPKNLQQNTLVIHAASVGEVIALKPLVQQLMAQPNCPKITLTTFTPTGSAQVSKIFGEKVQHCYFPLDLWPCSTLFLHKLKPAALILMETELWPNTIAQCARQSVPLLLINARLSNSSMNGYRKLSWLIKPSLQHFEQILTQSTDNKENFISLGSNADNTKVSGNLKYDISITEETSAKTNELKHHIENKRPIWLVASTHPGDEDIILAAFAMIKKAIPNLLLVLVPRHPERFSMVKQRCLEHHWQVVSRSEKLSVTEDHDIWLIDTLGELLSCCALADIVTMGGSFSNIGGHNPLEPALFEKPIIVGHDMANFKEVTQQLHNASGICQLEYSVNSSLEIISQQLAEKTLSLLNNAEQCQQMGKAALSVVKQNQGASFKTQQAILNLLSKN
ncbi:lipid IV(A) 3-deoxy-D-manno-octulosonic acid transferase [Thalassotalea sp. 1_MG-2023]|uniref:lipid IV(A) 3-deoxy-D-manno-octulosonic acid transferase n=1 Tax=Thalassotalea sp. 1_MG-2023 TaxID=3062680 RepID=UPI0026E401D2|nr:lipid IV(A) 3-deoxy-D-manno-octulosonic acid transferase [Thalassotalea sp. 1_MG-2023]MDO6425418.1 lipid IV(A) 3-deoxy-D-manno-octulosonic acid transferase [Thalassotalea sp. 1_MG-2023]